jgi:heterodisulfide reductase subunit C2
MDQTVSVLQLEGGEDAWARSVAAEYGIRAASCYQCLRCTSSCPVSAHMDIKPHQVVRLAQLGQKEKLLASSAIWICLSCEMCSTYCPNEVDVAGLMNHLKNEVVMHDRKPAEYEIAAFHESFLDVVRMCGRMNDLHFMQIYKMKTLLHGYIPPRKEMIKDLKLAVSLLKRKRLRVMPEWSRGAGEIRQIIKQHNHKGGSS